MAPNDFFLFPYDKLILRRQRFSSAKEAIDAFVKYVLEISQAEWKLYDDKWFEISVFYYWIQKINSDSRKQRDLIF